MNDIKFNCPHCGQSLAVDAASAGTAVACPQCGQTISVPQSAQMAKAGPSAQTSSRGKGLSLAVLVVLALLLLVAGLLFSQMHVRPGGARASVPALPANLTTNLVFYFNFGSKPSGGMVPDLSGNGNNGDADNVQWVADGHRGGALVFSPTDSHIRVPNNASLNPPQFTLYAWIKTSYTDHHWRRIFDKGLFHHDFSLSVAGDYERWDPPTKNRGYIVFEMPKSGITSRHSIADDKWHQLAATYDGRDAQLFIDGQLQGKRHRPNISLGNDLDLVIGGFTDPDPDNDDPHASFAGSLDDVIVFNRALSPDEVAALYDSQKTASDKPNESAVPAAAPVEPPPTHTVALAPAVQSAGPVWPADRFLPTFPPPAPVIDCIDVTPVSPAAKILFASLEGLVNRQQPRLACVDIAFTEGRYSWLKLHHLSYNMINGYDAIQKYRASVAGLVVTDSHIRDTVNLATALAGLNDELICDPRLLKTLTNAPCNLRVMDDLRGKFSDKYEVYHYLYTNCWPRCTHRIIAGLAPNSHFGLRDYLVALKGAAVSLDPAKPDDASALEPFLAEMKPMGGLYMGWWANEGAGLGWIAQFGIPVVASDFYANGSLFSGVASPISIPPIPPPPPLQNKVYVAIVMSDGDNMQYVQHRMKWGWEKSARGTVPLGWTVQPIAADMDPAMLNYYWSTATSNDCLVAGPSGAGYNYLDHWSPANIAAFTRTSDGYLQRSGTRVINVFTSVSPAIAESFARNCPSLLGLIDQSGGAYAKVYDGLPVIGFAGGGNNATSLIHSITNSAADWNGSAPKFIAVQGDAWNTTPADVQEVVNALDKNEYVVVRPDQLFLLDREAEKIVPHASTQQADRHE